MTLASAGRRALNFRAEICFVLLIAGVAIAPQFNLSDYVLQVLTVACIYGILASSWDLVTGCTGLLTFGHAGFFGLGAYTSALLSLHLSISPWWGLVLAGVMCAAAGFLVGLLSLRVSGIYLALTTLAFAEVLRTVAIEWESLTRGPRGLYGYPPFSHVPYTGEWYLYLALALLVATSLLLYAVMKSTIGTRLRAIREDETLAQAHGLNVRRYKLLAFILSSSLAGLAGAFYAHFELLITPDRMAPMITALIVAMAAIGGLGTILGPVLGAFIVQGSTEALRNVGVTYHLILVGVAIVVITLYFPGGIFGRRRATTGQRRMSSVLSRGGASRGAATEEHSPA